MRKLLSTAVALGILASTSLLPAAYAGVSNTALPIQDKSLNDPNVDVTTPSTGYMNIEIRGGKNAIGTARWNSFNIGSDATVHVQFTDPNQTSLNYVNASGGMSQIFGKFNDSCSSACTARDTGKVILINPNGILFGSGANVDLNSFTGSTLNGTYTNPSDSAEGTLILNRTGKTSRANIVVEDGVTKLYGDKGITFVSDNDIYVDSKISTNYNKLNASSTNNTNGGSYDLTWGKVKLYTTDGVTFKYKNSGTIDGIVKDSAGNEILQNSTAAMVIKVNSDITSGHIDIRNKSTNKLSEISVKDATLKAYKAVNGTDGNIWLVANDRIITENSKFITENNTGAASKSGGNLIMAGGNVTTLNNDEVNVVGNVTLQTSTAEGSTVTIDGKSRKNNGAVKVDSTSIIAGGDVLLNSAQYASSVQNGSSVSAQNVTVNGKLIGQVSNSTVTATKDINVASTNTADSTSNAATVYNSTLTASQDININKTGTKATANVNASTLNATRDINVYSKGNTTISNATINNANKNSSLTAGQDISITSTDAAVNALNSTLTANRNLSITSKSNIDSSKLANSTLKATTGNINLTSTGTTANDATVGNILLTDTSKLQTPATAGRLNLTAAKNIQIIKDGALSVTKTNFNAGDDVSLISGKVTNGELELTNTVTVASTTGFTKADNVYIQGKNVNTSGTVNMNQQKTNIVADENVNVTLSGVDSAAKGLVASAGNNMTITAKNTSGTNGTLSVASLISGNDMTINANKVIKGQDYMSNPSLGGFADKTSSRSYIEVGGTFTSNVATNNYTVTESKDLTNDGQYNQRHHIQYGSEKLYLVNKKAVNNNVTDPEITNPDAADDIDIFVPGSISSSTGSTTWVTPKSGKTATEYTGGNGGNQDDGGNKNTGSGTNINCTGDAALLDDLKGETLKF